MATARITGQADVGPASVATAQLGDFCTLPLAAAVFVQHGDKNQIQVLAAAVGVVAALVGVVGAKVLAITTTAPVTAKITYASGTDQKVPISKSAHIVSEDSPITGLKFDGGSADATVSYLYGGDPS